MTERNGCSFDQGPLGGRPSLTAFDHLDENLGESTIWNAYARLSEQGPAAYSPKYGGFWTITHAEVLAALRDYETSSSSYGRGSKALPLHFEREPVVASGR